jgi:hypothetical protein
MDTIGTAMTTADRTWRPWLWDGAAAAIVTAAIVATLLAAGGIWAHVGGDDLHGWFLPRYEEAARALFREGRLPLWNPWEFCGSPLLAQAQGSIYPPVPPLFAALRPYWALQALVAFDVLALAWGIVAYLRHHGIARWAGGLATAVTVAGVFSTPSGVGIDHPDFLASLAWVPWVFLCWENAMRRGARPWLGLLGLAVGMEWLGGYPDFGMDVAVLLGAAAIVSDGAPAWRRVALAAAGYAIGTAVAAIQILPLAEALGESVRASAQPGFELTRQFMALGRTGLWRAVAWGALGPGLAAWALVALGVATGRRHRLVWLVALVWCLFALDPPLDLLYRLPPFSGSRYPHGWSNLAPLFIGLLAAAGAVTTTRRAPRLARILVLVLVVGAAARAGRTIAATPTRLGFAAPDRTLIDRRMAVIERAVATLPDASRIVSRREQNAGMDITRRLRAAGGYDPSMPPKRVRRLIDEINANTRMGGLSIFVARSPRLAALLGVGLVTAPVGPPARMLEARGFRVRAALPPNDVLLHRRPVPRARLVHRVVAAAGDDAVVARLRDPTHDLERTVVLDPADARTVGPLGAPTPMDVVRIVRDEPERLALDTRSRAPALAVVTDAYYPGWEATVDGTPTRILRADLAFRAVPVPAGAHHVSMRYAPASVRAGALVSLCALLVAGTLLVARRGDGRA